MTSAYRHRSTHRRALSRQTIIVTVICGLVVLLVDVYNSRSQREDAARSVVALTALPPVRVAEPDPARTPYKRDTYQPHGWIDADGDGCNTRREVLIQESAVQPSINPDGCRLSGGKWTDRFVPSFSTTRDQDVQIDHLVALADADRSGAWRWPAEKKIAFSNDIDNPDELNAISNAVNNEKSDKAPDEWLPQDQKARCDYLRAYLTIKSQWDLTVSPAQWQAIAGVWPSCT